MKNRAFMALLLGAAGVWACGGGGSKVHLADAGADGGSGICNPVTQEGCGSGEKCADSFVGGGDAGPALHRTACVPDGTAATGDACSRMADDSGLSYDNCKAGNTCITGSCLANCTTQPDSCGDTAGCTLVEHLFDDYTQEMLGVCIPACNPVTQDCTGGDACFLNLGNGKGACIPSDDTTHTQGQECANNGSQCYLDGCSAGYGAYILDPGNAGLRLCTSYCLPVNTYLDDPDGDGLNTTAMGNAQGDSGPPDLSCGVGRIGGGATGYQCRFFQSFFVDQNNQYLDYISDGFGFCSPNNTDYGDCAKFDWPRIDYIYNNGFPDNTNAGTSDAVQKYCMQNADACAGGCVSLATLQMQDDAYCANNMGTPACPANLKMLQRPVYKFMHKYWMQQAQKLGLPAGMMP